MLGHGVAVECGDDGWRRAGNTQQNRRNGAAVHGAVIDAGHHPKGDQRVHGKGQRNQDGDTHGRGQTWQGTDDHSGDGADDNRGEIGPLENDGQRVQKRIEHERYFPSEDKRATE